MKVFTSALAITLGLLLSGVATGATQDLRNPDQVAPASKPVQDLRNPDQVAPAPGPVQDLRNPDQIAPNAPAVTEPAPLAQQPVVSTDVVPAPDGGLSTLLIILIACGGAAALAAAAFGTMRVIHAHGRHLPT